MADIDVSDDILLLRKEIAEVHKDVKQLLEVFLKLFEQFNELKDSPMLQAFFPAPRKK